MRPKFLVPQIIPQDESLKVNCDSVRRDKGMNELKNNLARLIRERPGLTQARLCKELGLSESVLSAWIRGTKPRNIDDVKAVADFFGITLDSLVYGDGTSQEQEEITYQDVGEFRIVVQKIQKIKKT